jgi:hypothetical protein
MAAIPNSISGLPSFDDSGRVAASMNQAAMPSPAFPINPWENASPEDTWESIIRALFAIRSPWTLRGLYDAIGTHPKVAGRSVRSWCGKIRQRLERQRGGEYVRIASGIWDAASKYNKSRLMEFEIARRKRYPRRRT